jgi:uncharacterized membrane protein
MRNFVLAVHIICVAAWLGANIVLAFASPMNNSAEAPVRRWWASVQNRMGKLYYNIAGVLVLLTGLYLVIDSDFISFADAFVSIGFVVVIIAALIGIFVMGPGTRELMTAIDEGDGTRERAINNRLAAVGMVDTLLVVLAIFAMVGKWGLG